MAEITEAQLFEQLGRMMAENTILRRENAELRQQVESLTRAATTEN